MRVKGSAFIRLIKVIRSDKSGVYDKYLTEQDRKIVNERLLPSIWYPFETYQNCITAVFDVVAKKNARVAKEWGRIECEELMTKTYSSMISNRDPLTFLKKYEFIHKTFYDFGNTEIIEEGQNQVVFNLSNFNVKCVPVYYIVEGWLEHGLELCGANNIRYTYLSKGWEGHPTTSMRLKWF